MTCANLEGGGQAKHTGNHKKYSVSSGPDPLKPSQLSMLGQRKAIKMAFRWRADDGPLIVVFGSSHQLKCQLNPL